MSKSEAEEMLDLAVEVDILKLKFIQELKGSDEVPLKGRLFLYRSLRKDIDMALDVIGRELKKRHNH